MTCPCVTALHCTISGTKKSSFGYILNSGSKWNSLAFQYWSVKFNRACELCIRKYRISVSTNIPFDVTWVSVRDVWCYANWLFHSLDKSSRIEQIKMFKYWRGLSNCLCDFFPDMFFFWFLRDARMDRRSYIDWKVKCF